MSGIGTADEAGRDSVCSATRQIERRQNKGCLAENQEG